jgi:hypothetical protein
MHIRGFWGSEYGKFALDTSKIPKSKYFRYFCIQGVLL